jgi:hypothetical protein
MTPEERRARNAERQRSWRARNPDRANAIAAAGRQRNRAKIAAIQKIYRQNNKAKLYEYKKAYLARNPEKLRPGAERRTSVFVRRYLRGSCAELDSLAHFPHGGGERFNLLLLLCDGRLEFGNCALRNELASMGPRSSERGNMNNSRRSA